MKMFGKLPYFVLLAAIVSCTADRDFTPETTILKWPEGKTTAVSLTYDDGSINQFRIALPLMDSLGFRRLFTSSPVRYRDRNFNPNSSEGLWKKLLRKVLQYQQIRITF
jgi:hypothetical protein